MGWEGEGLRGCRWEGEGLRGWGWEGKVEGCGDGRGRG